MIPSSEILILKSDTDKVGNACLTLILNSILTQEQVHRDVPGSSSIQRWRLDQVAATQIPLLSREKQVEIEQRRSESFQMRHRSKKLLENAKIAVEIAIAVESTLRRDPQDPHVRQENTHRGFPSRPLDRQTRWVLGAEVGWSPWRDRLLARVATLDGYF